MSKTIIAQGFSIIAYAIFIAGMFRDEKKNMLLWDIISRASSIVRWILLGSMNGLEHSILGATRAAVFRKTETNKSKGIAFGILLAFSILIYGRSFAGIGTMFFMGSVTANLIGYAFGNEQGVRMGVMVASVCNIIAFTINRNYAGAAGELVVIVLTFVAFVKYARTGEK